MLNKKALITIAALTSISSYTWSSTPQELCNEMYPADAYEYEERMTLMRDCVAMNSEPTYEEESYQEEPYPEASSAAEEPDYYEGTVEDFVNEIPAQE